MICFNSDKITKNDHKTIQLLSSNSPTKSKTELNSNKMLNNRSDDSNSSDDEIIKVHNSETSIAQVLFVGIILSYLVKFC